MDSSAHRPNQAVTVTVDGLLAEIVTEVRVTRPSIEPRDPLESYHLGNVSLALWDTGATDCAISRASAERLGLEPISFARVSHAGGQSLSPVYFVELHLPNSMMVLARVSEAELIAGGFEVIIGMSIICLGDFTITNYDGHTTFSFRIPSVSKIDFVAEASL